MTADEATIVVLGGWGSWLTRATPCFWSERYRQQSLTTWRWRVLDVPSTRPDVVIAYYHEFSLGRFCQAAGEVRGGQYLAYRKRVVRSGEMFRFEPEHAAWVPVDAPVCLPRWGRPTPRLRRSRRFRWAWAGGG